MGEKKKELEAKSPQNTHLFIYTFEGITSNYVGAAASDAWPCEQRQSMTRRRLFSEIHRTEEQLSPDCGITNSINYVLISPMQLPQLHCETMKSSALVRSCAHSRCPKHEPLTYTNLIHP